MIICPTCGIKIIEHPANRCMDALIAKKVMGWNKIVIGGVGWFVKESPLGMSYQYMTQSGDFEPSTDITAAWQVVERIVRPPDEDCWTGPTMQINAETTKSKGEYQVVFEHLDSIDLFPSSVEATAETAPLAICRAALLAVMEG